MTMNFDPVTDDPAPDNVYPAALEPVIIKSKGSDLLGNFYIARGEGPHPTVVLLHGFPGNECNYDMAHVLRRAGWNVLVFHYRGSWGSKGSFSFSNCVEDVSSALSFLRSETWSQAYRVNPDKIVLIGYSLGGFAGMMTAAKDPGVPAVGSIAGFNIGLFAQSIMGNKEAEKLAIASFEQDLAPLQGTSGKALIQEMISHAEPWNLLTYSEELSRIPLLLIGGSRDEVAPVSVHHFPLVRAVKGHPNKLASVILESGHLFLDKRIALTRTVLNWLNTL
ncbi:MAG: alpha/beta fold hydrolase [Theionarchaea archaeon]|nr:alpha/beta fold hydrolase [Theionarchaea archaeon]